MSSLLKPRVSVVIPCRDEENWISGCLESVCFGSEAEIIVVDSGSSDGSRKIIDRFAAERTDIAVLENPQLSTSHALNKGIQASRGEFVLILGAHCEMSPDFMSKVLRRFTSPVTGCVGGRTVPISRGGLQKVISLVLQSRFGVGNSSFRLPGIETREVDTVAYGVYRREVFEKVGLFDTRLTRNQDIEFNFRLRKAGYKIILDPSAKVFYSPRRTLGSFCRQNYGNGFWNVITWKLVPGSLSWRHFVPLAFVLGLATEIIGGFWLGTLRLALEICLSCYFLLDIMESSRIALREREWGLLATAALFPILHISYGIGSVCGLLAAIESRWAKTRQLESPNTRAM